MGYFVRLAVCPLPLPRCVHTKIGTSWVLDTLYKLPPLFSTLSIQVSHFPRNPPFSIALFKIPFIMV